MPTSQTKPQKQSQKNNQNCLFSNHNSFATCGNLSSFSNHRHSMSYMLVVGLTVLPASYAAANSSVTSDPALDKQLIDNAIYQQQHNDELQRIEKQALAKQIADKKYQADTQASSETTQTPSKQSKAANCLNYDAVEVRGVTLLDLQQVAAVPEDCISKQSISQFTRALTKAYLKQGYISTSIDIQTDAKQINRTPNIGVTPSSKRLIIKVNEGRVAAITSKTSRVNAKNLFPKIVGKPLSIADLDQGIDNAERLVRNKIIADVYPNDDGTVDIELSNITPKAQQGYVSGYVSIDNSANDNVGKLMGRFSTNFDSPFNLSDSLTVSGSHPIKTLKDIASDDVANSRSLAINYTVPNGYWRTGLFGSYSDYRNIIELQYAGAQEQTGSSKQFGVSSDYTFSRGNNHVAKATARLEKFSTDSYFAGSQLAIQTYDISSANLGINSFAIKPNGFNSISGFVETDLSTSSNQQSYVMWGLDGSMQRYHSKLFDKKVNWRNQHSLSARYTNDVLPAVKQSSLLSGAMVRGFDKLSSNGEQAIALQSTIYMPKKLVSGIQLEPYLGLDIGVQKENLFATNTKAMGGVIGFTARKNHAIKNDSYKLSVEYGKGKLKKRVKYTTKVDSKDVKNTDNKLSIKLQWQY